jgi:hypothetical protein
LDYLARAQDRTVEAVTVTHDQIGAGARSRIDHPAAFLEGERHRLFDERVLTVRRRHCGMRRVMLVRRGDVDDFHIRIGAQFCDEA